MDAIKELIRKYTGHDFVYLMDRANTAIEAAIRVSGGTSIAIPDQGGWFSYPKIPKKLGLAIHEIKTDAGLIDPSKIDDSSVLLYSNPAAYYANQDISGIRKHFLGKIIMDVSGSIGDPELCNGNYADFMVGSFGKWKAADLGYGGFLSSVTELMVIENFDHSYDEELLKKLQSAPKRLAGLYSECKRIKGELNDLKMLHPEKKGVNIILSYDNEEQKERIKEYCKANDLEIVQCPNYIKVMRPAISIEIRRIEVKP